MGNIVLKGRCPVCWAEVDVEYRRERVLDEYGFKVVFKPVSIGPDGKSVYPVAEQCREHFKELQGRRARGVQ